MKNLNLNKPVYVAARMQPPHMRYKPAGQRDILHAVNHLNKYIIFNQLPLQSNILRNKLSNQI